MERMKKIFSVSYNKKIIIALMRIDTGFRSK